jgi:hypothetical protein
VRQERGGRGEGEGRERGGRGEGEGQERIRNWVGIC